MHELRSFFFTFAAVFTKIKIIMENKKTTEQAYKTLQEIKAGLSVPDAIKEHEMPTLCNFDTGKETGFAVILTLSTKYDYTNRVLEDWCKRLDAEGYHISVKRSQLKVRFDVMY